MDAPVTNQPHVPLRVCFFGSYRANYVRNQVMIAGLRAQGATVYECHAPLWRGVPDRVAQASGGWRQPRFWLRVLRAYWQLLHTHRRIPPYDVMLVGYPGQFDVYLGWLLSRWRSVPLALDILMSLHLIAEERGLTQLSPTTGRLIYWLERGGLHLPDLLIADTPEYRDYYAAHYHLPLERFTLVPLGVDDRLFFPRPHLQPPADVVRVIYYGTFIPLHGIPTLLRAAALLRDQPHIQFDLYGDGQERPAAEQLAAELGLTNVHFHSWVDSADLPDEIARAHICLGVFGNTQQSRCTIQNKIWEGLAMQRPVITGDSETVRTSLTHGQHLYLVPRENPQALAQGLLKLAADPALRQRLAQEGYRRFLSANTITALGATTLTALQTLCVRRNQGEAAPGD